MFKKNSILKNIFFDCIRFINPHKDKEIMAIVKEIKKEEETVVKETGKITKKLRENPWILASLVLGVVVLVLLYLLFFGGIYSNEAGKNIVTYLNTLTGGGVTLVSVNDLGSLYEITVKYRGDDIPVYSTKDGKYFVQAATEINPKKADTNTNTNTQTTVPKTEKPSAELYIFSYCPAGTSALKSFATAGKLLGKVADMQVKFFSHMHGEHEKQQNMIQECIQQIQKDKY